MRDMGITDDSLARRALEATGGNLQAAIELIFGDGIWKIIPYLFWNSSSYISQESFSCSFINNII